MSINMQYDTIDDRAEVDRAFEALKAATPVLYREEFKRLMLMGRLGNDHEFKHKDMRRGFAFDTVTGTFREQAGEGTPISAEDAYEWACS